jgi:hypothetical protein
MDGISILRRRPIHGLDTDALRQHVEAFESKPQNLVIQRLSPGHLLVSGSFLESEMVEFATTYSRYWTATVVGNGERLAIQRDGLDFMYFKPPTGSPSTIELVYEGGSVGVRFLSRILQVIG